jgi:hypothetical protein
VDDRTKGIVRVGHVAVGDAFGLGVGVAGGAHPHGDADCEYHRQCRHHDGPVALPHRSS